MNLNLIQFAAHTRTFAGNLAINQPAPLVASNAIHFSDRLKRCGFHTYFSSKKMLRFVVLAFFGIYFKKLNQIEFASKAADTILYAAQKWLLTILAILITFNKFCIADDAAAIAMSSMLPLLLLHFCSNEQASKCNSCYCWRCCCCWALLQCESFNDRKLNISALILSLRR